MRGILDMYSPIIGVPDRVGSMWGMELTPEDIVFTDGRGGGGIKDIDG